MLFFIYSIDFLTRSVPLTVCEFASLRLLHEKHVFSLHSLPGSWDSHLLSGGWLEFAVSPSHECFQVLLTQIYKMLVLSKAKMLTNRFFSSCILSSNYVHMLSQTLEEVYSKMQDLIFSALNVVLWGTFSGLLLISLKTLYIEQ